MKRNILSIVAVAAIIFSNPTTHADEIRIEIENAAPTGGFFFTPVFLGFHDGSFDIFNGGDLASGSLTNLAELGDTSGVTGDLQSAQGTAVAATVVGDSQGPPPFDPGESISSVFDLDPTDNRFLNYASMVIPSNDAFFGNDDALELFDSNGNFVGPMTIEITAGMIYDAGTEVNDINGGAAFSANGGTSVDESNPIDLINLNDLNDFIGTNTVSGATISSGFDPNTVVARISISVPEPGSMMFLGVGGGLLGLVRRRRA